MKRHNKQVIEPFTQINLTPLLDITFTLLIAFMIIAPTLKHGLKMELPEVKGAAISEKQKTLNVTVQKKMPEEAVERIRLNGKRVTLKELEESVHAHWLSRKDVEVIIEADKDVSWDSVIKAVGAVRNAGVDIIGFATEPPPRKSRR